MLKSHDFQQSWLFIWSVKALLKQDQLLIFYVFTSNFHYIFLSKKAWICLCKIYYKYDKINHPAKGKTVHYNKHNVIQLH
ncbi:MAG: hypothetical protein JWP12_1213 [Bacteroidetes bacterium]|nr:hypothetical protein [Bacteroidota bacterium]